MPQMINNRILLLSILLILLQTACLASGAELIDKGPAQSSATIEIMNVEPDGFHSKFWNGQPLHFLPDERSPLLEPKNGNARNIYAPSAVNIGPKKWMLFYGGWDGTTTGNDRIYGCTTTEFLQFGPRRTVVGHGVFQHVCNVNAFKTTANTYQLTCTAYPDINGCNKPAVFNLAHPLSGIEPEASASDILKIKDYPDYEHADINGMSVQLVDDAQTLLYFCDFHKPGHVYLAEGKSVSGLHYLGIADDCSQFVNDVKIIRDSNGIKNYLMTLHQNTDRVWYSLSNNAKRVPTPCVLFNHLGRADKYMVATGWVMDQPRGGAWGRVLGILYGAGANPGLAQNRIFARWLQKRLCFTDENGATFEARHARGPGMQVITLPPALPNGKAVHLRVTVFAEDGRTTQSSGQVQVRAGRRYGLSE